MATIALVGKGQTTFHVFIALNGKMDDAFFAKALEALPPKIVFPLSEDLSIRLAGNDCDDNVTPDVIQALLRQIPMIRIVTVVRDATQGAVGKQFGAHDYTIAPLTIDTFWQHVLTSYAQGSIAAIKGFSAPSHA